MLAWIYQQFFSLYQFFRRYVPQGGHKYHRDENGIESGLVAGTDNYRKAIEANIRIGELEKQLESMTKERFQLQENAREIAQLRKEKENAFKIIGELEKQLESMTKERFQLQENAREIAQLRKEKENAFKILREDNTPVVRDLTEPNRPMRIGDQFSELFENEWTDAYTVIDDSKFKDIETIKILLKILSEIYEICLANVNQQLSGHRSTVYGLSDDETEGFIKAVKDSIKINAPKYIPLLRKKITSDSSRCKTVFQYKDCCLLYIENCVNLCYYIAAQDPPMFIDFEPGKIFDKQSWKEYTRSGTEIEYVVWPALYLYKGGLIMSKGVVQPKETE